MSPLRAAALRILALALAAAPRAAASVATAELEPNGPKAEATLVACLAPGDTVTGATTGASLAAGDASLGSADTFRVSTCALPAGVWRHRLTLTTDAPPGHALSVRGLSVSAPGGVPTIDAGSDAALEWAVAGTDGRLFVQWYGFGASEELFVRVTGTLDTPLPYTLTLSSEPVAPVVVASAALSGAVEITTVGQGHSTDTELFVLDAAFAPVPGWRNDDEPAGATTQSRLARAVPAGTYHLAVGRYNVADAALSGADDDYQLGPVLDFPGALLSWSPTGPTDVSFSILDAQGSQPVPAALSGAPFEVAWFRVVVIDAAPPIVAVCAGDGTASPCPCGNLGGAGRGCASSVNASGGLLAGSGLASVALDGLVLQGSGLPVSSALYFQGTALANGGAGLAFGDGLRCATGAVLRLATKTSFGGRSQFPGAGEPPVSQRGLVPAAGGLRTYQVWYRNPDPAFCTSAFFNLTNALSVAWAP